MNEIDYKRSMNHSYMVITGENENGILGYQLKMIRENRMEGILFCDVREEDGKNKVYYDISGCESMEELFMFQEMDYVFCKKLMEQLFFVQDELQRYLLDDQNLQLKPNQIFISSGEKKIFFTYFPGNTKNEQGYKELSEYLLEKVNHKDDNAVKIAYTFYKESRCQQFTVETMKQVLEEIEEEERKTKEIPINDEETIVFDRENKIPFNEKQCEKVEKKERDKHELHIRLSKKKKWEICTGSYLVAIACVLYIYFEPVSKGEMIGFLVCAGVAVVIGMIVALTKSETKEKNRKNIKERKKEKNIKQEDTLSKELVELFDDEELGWIQSNGITFS